MADLDEVLREVAQKVLGLATEAQDPLFSVAKVARKGVPPGLKTPLLSLDRDKAFPKGLPEKGVGAFSRPPEEEVQRPAISEQESLRKLRECENKFRKKTDEVEKLKAKLNKLEKAKQGAESAKGRAEQEKARLHKDLLQVAEERDRLRDDLAKVQEEKARLQADKKRLEEQASSYKKQIDELKARLQELEGLAEEKEHLKAQVDRLGRFKEALPEPFPVEALLRVLVLDYPSLGNKAEERVRALIGGYRALLKGEDHPALRHSNRELLWGEPEGLVLLGVERLLMDLASLPLYE